MQNFDPVLTEKIIHFLKGNMSYNFVSGIENTNLHLQVRNRYPIFMDILLALSDCQGALGKHERQDNYYVIVFIIVFSQRT